MCFNANETALSDRRRHRQGQPARRRDGDVPNSGYTHQGWLSEDQRYFFSNDETDETGGQVASTRTLIWDVAELDDPILVREYFSENRSSDHNLYVLGSTMYQSNY